MYIYTQAKLLRILASPPHINELDQHAWGGCRRVLVCGGDGSGCEGHMKLELRWQAAQQVHPHIKADLTLQPIRVSPPKSPRPFLQRHGSLGLKPFAVSWTMRFETVFAVSWTVIFETVSAVSRRVRFETVCSVMDREGCGRFCSVVCSVGFDTIVLEGYSRAWQGGGSGVCLVGSPICRQ